MFGWPHADVKEECAYLAKAGWMGVRVFPVMVSLILGGSTTSQSLTSLLVVMEAVKSFVT
jgi:hypothetical protein